jgi:hypothetical protein
MHPGLEQCWELKKAGKGVYDLDEAYQTAIDPATKHLKLNLPLTRAPEVDPELLKRVLDQERAAEAARRAACRSRWPQEVSKKTERVRIITADVDVVAWRHYWGHRSHNGLAADPSTCG